MRSTGQSDLDRVLWKGCQEQAPWSIQQKFKPRFIEFAEDNGYNAAADHLSINIACVNQWCKQKVLITKGLATHETFTGLRKPGIQK